METETKWSDWKRVEVSLGSIPVQFRYRIGTYVAEVRTWYGIELVHVSTGKVISKARWFNSPNECREEIRKALIRKLEVKFIEEGAD